MDIGGGEQCEDQCLLIDRNKKYAYILFNPFQDLPSDTQREDFLSFIWAEIKKF